MILVCSGLTDLVTELLCARLRDRGYPYRLLDLSIYPAGFRINWRWGDNGPAGYIAGPDWQLDLKELSSVYVRYPDAKARVPPAGLAPEFAFALHAECDAGLATLLECLPCPVVNRLAGGMSNQSKPYQALHIRRCGLMTPDTLLTSDPQEVGRFYEECKGQVIYKSISGVHPMVRRLTAAHLARPLLMPHGPAQFQALIPGDDIRVHTVGDRCFATRIRSAAIDYRYARDEGHTVVMEPATLPPRVDAACVRIAHHFNLLLAGIDLRETPEGHYYCFEVNPAPEFLWYEQGSSQPISSALAELLQDGHNGSVSKAQKVTVQAGAGA